MRFKKLIFNLTIFTALHIFMGIGSAHANQILIYGNITSPTLRLSFNTFLGKNFKQNISEYQISSIDLNRDGINEHVLKSRSCANDDYKCAHLIFAEKPSKMILIGKIFAREVQIAKSSTHRIKDIVAFKNPVNQYNFNIYMWSSNEKMYILNDE